MPYGELQETIRIAKLIIKSKGLLIINNWLLIIKGSCLLRSALFTPIGLSDSHIGAMVETAIFSQWLHRDWVQPYYARWTENKWGEVDLVFLNGWLKPTTAVEIKWSDRFFERPEELSSLIKFATEHHIKNPVVTTIHAEWVKEYKWIQIEYIPAALYAYTVWKRTMKLKNTLER